MKIIKQELGAVLLEPRMIKDNRGWFQVPFSIQDLHALNLSFSSVYQLNHSYTKEKGVIRGPNFQRDPYSQAKVIRCIRGSIYSVGIDLNTKSKTFGKHVGFILSSKNQYLMYLPRNYAHGFITLEEDVELEYVTDNEYNYESACSVSWEDPSLHIDWSCDGFIEINTSIMSDKNRNAPLLRDLDL